MTRKYSVGWAESLTIILALLFLDGCAMTKVTMHTVGNKPPLCRAQDAPQTALILWGTAWRDNQKEITLREETASRAIINYFNASSCFVLVEIFKTTENRLAIGLSDAEALKFAVSTGKQYQKVVIIRLEELGPFVIIYPSPILWEGGTEVVLRVRVLNIDTSALEADIAVHWKNSGAFILKGTRMLEGDLQAALASIFGEANSIAR